MRAYSDSVPTNLETLKDLLASSDKALVDLENSITQRTGHLISSDAPSRLWKGKDNRRLYRRQKMSKSTNGVTELHGGYGCVLKSETHPVVYRLERITSQIHSLENEKLQFAFSSIAIMMYIFSEIIKQPNLALPEGTFTRRRFKLKTDILEKKLVQNKQEVVQAYEKNPSYAFPINVVGELENYKRSGLMVPLSVFFTTADNVSVDVRKDGNVCMIARSGKQKNTECATKLSNYTQGAGRYAHSVVKRPQALSRCGSTV
jgi:hypothetical protein